MRNNLLIKVLFSLIITGDNGLVEYKITAGDDNNDFEIVKNGSILTKRSLDRETKSTYNLLVTATDSAKAPEKKLSSTVQVIKCFKFLVNISTENLSFLT